jgi:hypothetical protein
LRQRWQYTILPGLFFWGSYYPNAIDLSESDKPDSFSEPVSVFVVATQTDFAGKLLFLRPKMERKCFESGNKTCTFQTHFLMSFNLSFHRVDWMSGTYSSKNRTKVAVTHWQNLLEKFGHASILPVKLH